MRIYYLPVIAALAIAAELPVQWGGNKAAVKALGAIPLREYAPDSSLVVPEHHPLKARFPVIDAYSHSDATTAAEVALLRMAAS